MTAVIYAHYSSDNQREESIEGQIRECTVYCTLKRQLSKRLSFFFCVRPFGNALLCGSEDLSNTALPHSAASNQPSGLLLSPRFLDP